MSICGQCSGKTTVAHHQKRDAISKTPFFIRALLVVSHGAQIEVIRDEDNIHHGITLQRSQQLYGVCTIPYFCQYIADLD